MNSYLPELSADGTVKPVFNVDDFDRQNASVTYADLSDYAYLYGSNNFLGSNSFLDIFVTSINNIASTTLSYIQNLRSDAQAQIDSKTTLAQVQSNNNTFTGTNTFNTSLPTSTLTPTTSTQLTTKAYTDTKTTLTEVQANNNTWTGTNTFNTSLPTSTLTPSTSTQLVTKAYADTKTTLTEVQANNNVWTGTNTFNTSLPTSTLTPTNSTQLVTKAYADTKTTLSEIQANNNSWTGSNSYAQGISTGGYTSFYNSNLVVNAGAIYANKNINIYGASQLYLDSASGGNGITAVYRDQASKNLYISSSYYDNSVGGGVVFQLKNPNGLAGNYSDVLSVQPLSITANQPFTINSNLSVTGNINGKTPTQISYLDATSSIQTQFNTINNTLSGISYTPDITTIDNHVKLSTGNNLLIGDTYNVKSNLDDCITKLSGITYNSSQDITTINNHVLLPAGNNLLLGDTFNVKTNIENCITKLSGITYNSISDTTTIDNNVSISKNLVANNCFETFDNTISSFDFLEQFTNGVSADQDLATITLSDAFTKEINVNLSFSGCLFWRNSATNSNGKIQYKSKISSLTVYIYKNGSLWQSNVPQYNADPLFSENTFRLPYSIKTENFQFFLNNSLIKFLPDVRKNFQSPDVYSIRVTGSIVTDVMHYTISTNTVSTYTAGFLNFTPCIYANVAFSYNGSDSSLINMGTITATTINIVTYTHGTYATSSCSVNNNVYRYGMSTNTTKELQCSSAYVNNSYASNAIAKTLTATDSTLTNTTVTTATVSTATITNLTVTNASIQNFTGGFNINKNRNNVAGYMFNGNNSFSVMPIICSMKGISPDNADDYFVINPGFYFVFYRDLSYVGNTEEKENNGNTPIVYSLATKNTTSSIRVYFRSDPNETWTSAHEITFTGIS